MIIFDMTAITSGFGNNAINTENTICGHSFEAFEAPDNRKIKVRGSLLWDFVASEDSEITGLKEGEAIPLEFLPWVPRKLYFKVIIPIQVNWAFNENEDGAMDSFCDTGHQRGTGRPQLLD